MPRLSARSFPKPSKHSSGQAKFRLIGRDHYLGAYGTSQAEAAYADLAPMMLEGDGQVSAKRSSPTA